MRRVSEKAKRLWSVKFTKPKKLIKIRVGIRDTKPKQRGSLFIRRKEYRKDVNDKKQEDVKNVLKQNKRMKLELKEMEKRKKMLDKKVNEGLKLFMKEVRKRNIEKHENIKNKKLIEEGTKFWLNLDVKKLEERKYKVEYAKIMAVIDVTKKLQKKLEKQDVKKPTANSILIQLTYLIMKKKLLVRIIYKEFNTIVGSTTHQVNILNRRLRRVIELTKNANDWREKYIPLIVQLSKKIFHVTTNKERIKESLIDFYINSVLFMSTSTKKLTRQIRLAKIRDQKQSKKVNNLIDEIKIFLCEQIIILENLKKVLLNVCWPYLYYSRVRCIRQLEFCADTLRSRGYNPELIDETKNKITKKRKFASVFPIKLDVLTMVDYNPEHIPISKYKVNSTNYYPFSSSDFSDD